jgi:hypothetical protein
MTRRSIWLTIGLLVWGVALFTGCAPTGVGPPEAPHAPGAVLDADRMRIDAMIAGDAGALAVLLHEELIYTHSNGEVDTKASLMETLAQGDIDYRRIQRGTEAVRAERTAAVVSAPVEMEVAAGGQLHQITGVYTAVYFWQDGRWQLVAYQSASSQVQTAPR